MQKFWLLLNQPACYGPYQPKIWTPLATLFVEIFWNEKNWGGFRPNWVAPWKEFMISWKKRRFEIFRTTAPSRASGSWLYLRMSGKPSNKLGSWGMTIRGLFLSWLWPDAPYGGSGTDLVHFVSQSKTTPSLSSCLASWPRIVQLSIFFKIFGQVNLAIWDSGPSCVGVCTWYCP